MERPSNKKKMNRHNRIEKYFIHPPLREIQISQVGQNFLDIYNDCILDNNYNNNTTNKNK